jgi:hypothetical protein
MARRVATASLLSLLVVFGLILLVLPWVRKSYAQYFPEGFRNVDCLNVICKEGQFCQENKCVDVSPPITNQYTGY